MPRPPVARKKKADASNPSRADGGIGLNLSKEVSKESSSVTEPRPLKL